MVVEMDHEKIGKIKQVVKNNKDVWNNINNIEDCIIR
jgi:hypothetical protein